LYISVHATDPVLRHFLIGSPKTIKGDLMERLRRLAGAGIRLHAQIVLCPGLNDGPHLERTVRELGEVHPGVATVAVVPVGLTRHRDGLYPLRSITPAEAGATLDAIHAWQASFLARHGTRLVFAADELYLRAGRAIPPAAAYEAFSVVEDGVGLVRRFSDDFRRFAARPGLARWQGERVATVVTGELFGPILRRFVERLRVPGLRAEVVAVPNEFFGRAITVAGLLTGQDVARALSGHPVGQMVLIPRVALTETKGVFLDDVAPADLARHLGIPVTTVEPTARGLVDGLLDRTSPPA
jgi:putative radical SAM enzyme (TIGR03279 family)